MNAYWFLLWFVHLFHAFTIAYKGFFVAPEFIERNENDMKKLVAKLVELLKKKLGK